MKLNLTKAFVGLAVVMTVLLLTDLSHAQRRRARGRTYSKAQVGQIIKRVETRADNFVDNFTHIAVFNSFGLDHGKGCNSWHFSVILICGKSKRIIKTLVY